MAGNVRLEDMSDGPVAELRTGSDAGVDRVRETETKRSFFRLGAGNTRMTVAPSLTHASYQSLAKSWGRSSHQRLGLLDIAPDDKSQSHCWELGLAEHLAGRNSSSIGSRDYGSHPPRQKKTGCRSFLALGLLRDPGWTILRRNLTDRQIRQTQNTQSQGTRI